MKWNRFTLKTKTEAEDIVICTLAEVGIEGVEIQDKQPLTDEDKAQMFVDIMPEGPADDGIAYLNFYLEEDADKENILRWKSNNSVPMNDMLDMWKFLNKEFDYDKAVEARQKQVEYELEKYCSFRKKHGYSREELVEIQAEFGNEEVVDILTSMVIN